MQDAGRKTKKGHINQGHLNKTLRISPTQVKSISSRPYAIQLERFIPYPFVKSSHMHIIFVCGGTLQTTTTNKPSYNLIIQQIVIDYNRERTTSQFRCKPLTETVHKISGASQYFCIHLIYHFSNRFLVPIRCAAFPASPPLHNPE